MSFSTCVARRYSYDYFHYLWVPDKKTGLQAEPLPGGISAAEGVIIDTSTSIKRLGIATHPDVLAINVCEELECDFVYPDGSPANPYKKDCQRDYISTDYDAETGMNTFVRAELLLQGVDKLSPRALGSLSVLQTWEWQIGYTYALATQALLALRVPHPRQAPPVVE